MPSLLFQFHADPEELLDMADSWMRDHSLRAAVERLFPHRIVPVIAGELHDVASELDQINRIYLHPYPLDTSPDSTNAMIEANPGCLILSIGQRSDLGIRESALSAATDDPDLMVKWRHIRNQARTGMNKGAWVVNPAFGDRGRLPSHCYTERASQLAAKGMKMLAAAGWGEYEFDGRG